MSVHSTNHHGMFLIPILALFFIGIVKLSEEKKPWYSFLLVSLLVTPVFLSTVGSVYRASRLMVYVPLVTFIATLGVKKILEIDQKLVKIGTVLFFVIILILNFGDFAIYYWNTYPKTISQDFSPNFNLAMKTLSELTKKTGNKPYIESSDYFTHKADLQFFNEVYFSGSKINLWARNKAFPDKAYVLTGINPNGDYSKTEEIPSIETGQRTFYIISEK